MHPVQTGREYESFALNHLTQQGLQLIAQNFRVRDGEIDLIMQEGDSLVFIEVKYRTDASFSDVLEQIKTSQLARIRRTAALFLLQHGMIEHKTACRFDIVALTGQPIQLQWLKDAF